MNKQYDTCVECGKKRVIFYNDKCQACYRKPGNEFRKKGRWEYKKDVNRNEMNYTCRTLCDLIVDRQLSIRDMSGDLGVGLTEKYMRIIRKKYLERVIIDE